ncbi:hypothetical protein ES703_118575 [subsurface metagenome]
MFFADILEPGLDSTVGFVPADGCPFSFTALTDSLQGSGNAVGVVHILRDSQSLGAKPSLVKRVFIVTLDTYYLTVFNINLSPTAPM